MYQFYQYSKFFYSLLQSTQQAHEPLNNRFPPMGNRSDTPKKYLQHFCRKVPEFTLTHITVNNQNITLNLRVNLYSDILRKDISSGSSNLSLLPVHMLSFVYL